MAITSQRDTSRPPTYIELHKQAAIDAGLPSESPRGLIMITFVFASLLTVASIAQNAMFAMSISEGIAATLVMLLMYLGFDLGKIAGPSLVANAWENDNHVFSAFIASAFSAAVVASIAAGTGFMSSAVEGVQEKRMQASPAFTQNQQSQSRLQSEAAAVAV
ncbi:MAG: hypothetical protein R8K20_06310, partial [Gallionellaceae bacterium]